MRLLLLSDIHSSFENLKEILSRESFDAIVVAGDITHFRPADVFKADSIIAQHTDECFAVHGNCDHEKVLEHQYDGIRFIHRRSLRLDDFTIHGIGGSGITPFNTPSEYTDEEIMKMIGELKIEKEGRNILLTHCPPKGILDKTYSGVHAGCNAIREHVKSFDAILCGHIHEAHGVDDKITLAVNPGPVMWGRYALFDAEKMEVELRKI